MDPQPAWNEMLAGYRARDPDLVELHAVALRDWLEMGGFPPDTGGGRALGDDWHRCLARAGVAFALDYVEVWKGSDS